MSASFALFHCLLLFDWDNLLPACNVLLHLSCFTVSICTAGRRRRSKKRALEFDDEGNFIGITPDAGPDAVPDDIDINEVGLN